MQTSANTHTHTKPRINMKSKKAIMFNLKQVEHFGKCFNVIQVKLLTCTTWGRNRRLNLKCNIS